MRHLLISAILLLAACAPRGTISLVEGAHVPGAVVQPVFVATNRNRQGTGRDTVVHQTFGDARNNRMSYGRFDLSIPASHQVGQIEWPGNARPDPARHIVGVGGEVYADRHAFISDLRAKAGPAGEIVVSVHGYNVNIAEAIYRLGQVAHDYDASVPVVAFSWPSSGSTQGYVYDRDSVIFTRDALEDFLTALQDQGGFRITIVAHSMGTQLVMETLRQMSIGGRGRYIQALQGVALISPDIDEDVFVAQAARISPFPQPFVVMASSRDRVLGLSAFLTGRSQRLGSISDPEKLAGLPIRLIDLSQFEGGVASGHSTAFTAPAAIAALRELEP